jgi:hypothetical protein
MRAKPGSTHTASTTNASASPSVRVGYLASGSKTGSLLVDFDGNPGRPVAARSMIALDDEALKEAVSSRRPAVLLFENQDPARPIVVGLIAPEPGAALLGSLLRAPTGTPPKPVEARVDGKRVVIEGEQEVVLRCGEASIPLRRDGKVMLRGAYVETTAKGLNRIRGGSVKIN